MTAPLAPSASVTLDELLSRDDEAFVAEAYRGLLGREPDPEGMGAYLEQLRGGSPRIELLALIALSREGLARAGAAPAMRGALADAHQRIHAITAPEAASLEELLAHHDEPFVRCAYLTTLARDPDPEGLRRYVAVLRGGSPKMHILASLRRSTEGASCEALRRALHAALRPGVPDTGAQLESLLPRADTTFLARAYLLLAGRKPSPQELALQLNRLKEGTTRAQVARDLAQSVAAAQLRALLEAMDPAIRRQRWTRIPIVGRWIAALWGLDRDSPAENRWRRLENAVFLLAASVRRREGYVEHESQGGRMPASQAPQDSGPGEATSAEVLLRPAPRVAAMLASLPPGGAANDAESRRASR